MTIRIAVYCLQGLENLLKDELEWHGYENLELSVGCVTLNEVAIEDLYFLNAHIRIALNIDIILLESGDCGNFRDLLPAIESLDFSDFFADDRKFAVRAERFGKHEYGSMDMMREIATAITVSRENQGGTVTANLKDPDIYFRAYQRDQHFILGLNTNGQTLCKRLDYPFTHAAKLNRTIAAAMIWQSSFFQTGKIFDPLCGGGSLLYEAMLWYKNQPIAQKEDPLAFKRHHYFDEKSWIDQQSKTIDYQIPELQMLGADVDEERLAGARLNLDSIADGTNYTLIYGDATRLDYLSSYGFDEYVTNPPYGIRILKPKEVDRLYQQMASAAKTSNIKRVVAITTKKKSWLRAYEGQGFTLKSIQAVDYSNMPASIFDMILES